MSDVVEIDIRKKLRPHNEEAVTEVIASVIKRSKRFGVYPYYWKLTKEQIEYIRTRHTKYIYKKYGKGKGQRLSKESDAIFDEIFNLKKTETERDYSNHNKRYRNTPKNNRS